MGFRGMIAFFADNHFKARPGHELNKRLRERHEIVFHEDDLAPLPEVLADSRCALLALNWISDTSGNAHPGAEIESAVKGWVEARRPILLIHGASAAFHAWDWWRAMVGLRWVRGNDPDGFAPSTHPVRPYAVRVAKTRHPLAEKLRDFDLPKDEIYIDLEQTCPVSVLMETTTAEGTYPQAYVCATPWGGTLGGFIPGHAPVAFTNLALIENVAAMVDHLTAGSPDSKKCLS